MNPMTVIKRGKSYWIDIGYNRVRFRKRSPHNSYKSAQAYELLLRQRLARGEPIDGPKEMVTYTFKELARQWFDLYVRNNNKPSEISTCQYLLNATLLPFFGKMSIDKISMYDIEQYKAQQLQRNLSPKSINNHLSLISCCLKTAVDWGLLTHIPRIKPLKVLPQKFDYLTEAEIEQLLNNARGIWHDMILLAVRTGLRFGELIALRRGDIDFKKETITVRRNIVNGIEGSPKNNKSRTIPLTKSVLYMLKDRTDTSGYVYKSRNGKPLVYNSCRKALHRECARAQIRNIGWHTLRHSFASHLAAKQNSIIQIKELLGHSDIKMTMRYAHVNLSILKDAVDTLEPTFQLNDTPTAHIQTHEKLFSNISPKTGRGAGN